MNPFNYLPDGTKVRRHASLDTFQDELVEHGWAENTIEGCIITEDMLRWTTFHKLFDSVPTQILAKYPMKIRIFKDTPHGRNRTTITYGQYYQQDWRKNGWVIDASDESFTFPRLRKNLRKDAEDALYQQTWWWPERSRAQAEALNHWTFTERTSTDSERGNQLRLLRNMHYIPNPRMKAYWEKLDAYARRKTNQYRKIWKQPKWFQTAWWKIQQKELDVEGGVPPPDPVIPWTEAKEQQRPKFSRALGTVDWGKLQTFESHYKKHHFPPSWYNWAGWRKANRSIRRRYRAQLYI